MANTPLSLKTSTTVHVFDSYSLPSHTGSYALTRTINAGDGRWPGFRGDRGLLPRVMTIVIEIVADGTYRGAYWAAQALVDDLETLNRVESHEGKYRAVGLMRYSLQPMPSSVLLTIDVPVYRASFAPQWDSTGLTFDDVSTPSPRWDSTP